MNQSFRDLVEAADLNSLLRQVDALSERRDWDGLMLLERMCRQAVERGKQLWPIAEHITFRLVLEGPPEIAGPLVVPGKARFAPGPLSEVAASTHTFAELAEHLSSSQAREMVAAERVVRGEDLSDDPRAHPQVLELPLKLLDVEPAYRVATFHRDHVEVQEPSHFGPWETSTPSPGEIVGDEELEEALLDLVRPWFEESTGTAEVRVIDGDLRQAIGSLGSHEVAAAEIGFSQALELMAWAAAGGGVFGRRRGAAYGRFAGWWAVCQMCDLPWPPQAEEFSDRGSKLEWLAFDRTGDEPSGWRFGVACCSQEEGWACALYARDTPPPPG